MNTQTLQDIDIESIDPNPANPRQDIGDVSELAASIAEQGVQQNLVVVPGGDGRYTVVIGHRRLAAAGTRQPRRCSTSSRANTRSKSQAAATTRRPKAARSSRCSP
ncbi:MAG: ParB N-terminal domain-containing protein, partial [Bifidobacterium tibiigranuli]|nr:ParB N-terminal domain-containing protein [Bifidobacterium tibiigranuli]